MASSSALYIPEIYLSWYPHDIHTISFGFLVEISATAVYHLGVHHVKILTSSYRKYDKKPFRLGIDIAEKLCNIINFGFILLFHRMVKRKFLAGNDKTNDMR